MGAYSHCNKFYAKVNENVEAEIDDDLDLLSDIEDVLKRSCHQESILASETVYAARILRFLTNLQLARYL